MRIKMIAGRMVQMISISCESRMYLFVSLVETIAMMM